VSAASTVAFACRCVVANDLAQARSLASIRRVTTSASRVSVIQSRPHRSAFARCIQTMADDRRTLLDCVQPWILQKIVDVGEC
jgi:hypothetical protein